MDEPDLPRTRQNASAISQPTNANQQDMLPAKLTLTQAGGFAGLLRDSVVRPDQLEAGDARRLGELIGALQPHLTAAAAAGAGSQPAGQPDRPDPAIRDQRSYQLTLERHGCAPASCRFDDTSVPADVWPLLRFLQQHGTAG